VKCKTCGMALEQRAEKALSGEVQTVWAEVGTEDWVCPQTGNEHEAVEGEGMRYFEVEFTKIVHVIADNGDAAIEQAEAEVLDHVRTTGVIDWSNYDDCVRPINKTEY